MARKETINFYDPESGAKLTLDVYTTFTDDFEQTWKIGRTPAGIDWAIPVGWPNACSPICAESEPDAFYELCERSDTK